MGRLPKSTRLSAESAQLLFERSDNFVCTLDLSGRFTSINPAGEAMTGYTEAELLGEFATKLVPPEARERAIARFKERLAGTSPDVPIESALLRRDGTQLPISVSSVVFAENGKPEGVLGIVHDLSERRRASEALLESENQFKGSFESAAIGMALVAPDGRFLEVNQALCELVGYDAATLLSRTFQEITHADDLDLDLEYLRRMLAGEIRSFQMEKRYIHSSGRLVWVQLSVSLVRGADGTPRHLVSQIQDIDAQKRARQELKRREAQLEEAQQLAKLGSWEYLDETGAVKMSPELLQVYGFEPDEFVTIDRLQERIHPDHRADIAEAAAKPLEIGEHHELVFRVVLPDGTIRWFLSRSEPIVEDGRVVGKRGFAQDISERKRAEHRLLEAERRYRTLVEQLPLAMYIRPLDMSKPNIYVSPQVGPMLGYPAADWLSDPELLERIVHPDDRERVLAEAHRVRHGGAPVKDEYRYLKPDGAVVWVHDETHVVRNELGEPMYVQGFLGDITERKAAEAERDRLRDELHHAQRLEALGRLAGGVAHDFNNMLTAIKGYGDLLVSAVEPGTDAHEYALRILRATEQAADLPRQLLAFGRDQLLEPEAVDLNEVVAATGGLLERVIKSDVSVSVEPRARAPWAVADRTQLEHALVNLALNASDAMPHGGRLTVATDNVRIEAADPLEPEAQPGSYVVLQVSDTGIGMDEETRRRAFDPFFTTKPHGQGSGLGLSSVYGSVTQIGGFVLVHSAPGEGTTFSLHLPAADVLEVEPARPVPAGRGAILVAEDEEIVRDLATQVLVHAGYSVMSAPDGAEAMSLYRERRSEVAAVVTDIVMPNVGGRALAQQIRELDAELPIVFISGYHGETAEALQLGDGAALLEKPFAPTLLVETLERLLQGRPDVDPESALPSTLRCLVADDHPAVLDSVARFLVARGLRVDQAGDGAEAVRLILSRRPDVAVVDVAMQPSGIEVAEAVRDASPDTRVLLYTGHNDRTLVDRGLAAGARGVVLKEAPLSSLEEAIRVVAQGGTYVDPRLAAAVESAVPLPTLTPREQEVLRLVASGLTNEKVGVELGISPETVQSHVRHAMVKLGADTRTEAVATALRLSVIS